MISLQTNAGAVPAVVAALVVAGADPNAETGDVNGGWTALHIVAQYSSATVAAAAVVEALVAAGADPNAKTSSGKTSSGGWTALHFVAGVSRAAVAAAAVRALVDAGADVHSPDDCGGWTALHRVAYQDSPEAAAAVVAALAAVGADVNAKANSGEAPLHAVAQRSSAAVGPAAVRALVDSGADVHQRDSYGETALHRLALNARPGAAVAILQALLEEGADMNAPNNQGACALVSDVLASVMRLGALDRFDSCCSLCLMWSRCLCTLLAQMIAVFVCHCVSANCLAPLTLLPAALCSTIHQRVSGSSSGSGACGRWRSAEHQNHLRRHPVALGCHVQQE